MRYILPLLMLVLCSCTGHQSSGGTGQGDTLQLKYSELLNIVRYDDYTIVDVADPWKEGRTLHRYVLVDKDQDSTAVPHGTLVRIPLERTIPFTSVHSSLLLDLDKGDAIAAMADLIYVRNAEILKMVEDGCIADVGMAATPDVERIIDISPDALLVSPFENSGGYGKLEQMGIPLIECADYMETSPLGRAEWVRFYGMLYGAKEAADALFAAVDSSYNALKTLAVETIDRPSVLMDKMTGSTWYLPGGNSTMGRMLADAGISYAFADNESSGSLALSFETVLEECGEADIWLFRYSADSLITYEQLLSGHRGYAHISPFNEGQCYGCNVENSAFFDEVPFRPDLLLRDFLIIAHPECRRELMFECQGETAELRYFHPINHSTADE